MCDRQTDRQTDGVTDKVTTREACASKNTKKIPINTKENVKVSILQF